MSVFNTPYIVWSAVSEQFELVVDYERECFRQVVAVSDNRSELEQMLQMAKRCAWL